MSSDRGSQLATGVVFIAVGLIFLAGQQHLLGPMHLRQAWPLILIVLGLGRFVAKTEDGKHRGGLWLIFIGGIFLLHNYRIMTLDESWPLFVVALGVSLVFGERHRQVGAKS